MRSKGIKAFELIAQLQNLIDQHGDREVITSGADYSEEVRVARFQTRDNDPYIPEGTIYIA